MSDDFEGTQVISDPSDLKKYRTELPNLYDDADLDVYEFRLLAHYKRVGKCTEGLETTSKKCKMSEGTVSKARQSLAVKGWITLQKVAMDKGRYRFIVHVADRWIENFTRYSWLSAEEIEKQLKKASPSPHEGIPSGHEASPSPHEGKKEPIKNLRLSLSARDFENMTVQEARQVPTLKMYAQATDFFPGSVVWKYVHDFIIANKLTEEQIRTAFTAWKLRGHRSENIEGILEWARDGVPQKGKGASNGNSKSPRSKPKSPAQPERTPDELERDIKAAEKLLGRPS